MFKAFFLIFFYSVAAVADESPDVCLGIKKLEPNKLTFFYTRQDESDKPYFYVKPVIEESEGAEATLQDIQKMVGYLLYIPKTDPHQYQVPEQVKKIYVVRSKNKLTDFSASSQVVPTVQGGENVVRFAVKKKRNANNNPHPLPPKTKTRGISTGDNGVKICEFDL